MFILRIITKFKKAGFPYAFINSVITTFNSEREEQIIPWWLFDDRKEVYFQLPFCQRNEREVYNIIKRLLLFSNNKVKFKYYWKTRKIRSLFPLKDRVNHASNVIYKGTCSCNESYIGETKRNAEIRWKEHCSNKGNSEVGEHLLKNSGHKITWEIISKAPNSTKKRKILETYYIRKFKPTINEQLDIKFTQLFKNGIT